MSYIKTFKEYQLLNEAYHQGDILKTSNFGEVRIVHIEDPNDKPTYHLKSIKGENTSSVSDKALKGAKLIKSPYNDRKKQKKLDKAERSAALKAARLEKYKNQIAKKEYDNILKGVVSDTKGDMGSDADYVMADIADNLLFNSKIKDYLKRYLDREESWDITPKQQLQWDLETWL